VSGHCQAGMNRVYTLDLDESSWIGQRPQYASEDDDFLYWSRTERGDRWYLDADDYDPASRNAYFDSTSAVPPAGSHTWRMWCNDDGNGWDWRDGMLSIDVLSWVLRSMKNSLLSVMTRHKNSHSHFLR
jgi:hypothetical protein